jgi:hypothetical protein
VSEYTNFFPFSSLEGSFTGRWTIYTVGRGTKVKRWTAYVYRDLRLNWDSGKSKSRLGHEIFVGRGYIQIPAWFSNFTPRRSSAAGGRYQGGVLFGRKPEETRADVPLFYTFRFFSVFQTDINVPAGDPDSFFSNHRVDPAIKQDPRNHS